MIEYDLLRHGGKSDVAYEYTTPQANSIVVGAPGVGRRIRVLYYEFSVGVTATPEPTCKLYSDLVTLKGAAKYFNFNGGGAFDQVLYDLELNQALTVVTNVTGNHSLYVQYTILGN